VNLPVKHQPIEKKPRKEHGRAVTSPREADKEPAQLRGAAKEPAQLRGAGGTAAVLSGIPGGAQHPLQAR